MNVSRKRKKELRQLQNDAGRLWESQQVLVGQASDIAREAGRQLGNFNREQVVPAVQESYERHVAPTVNRGMKVGKQVVDERVVPIVGGVVGTALTAWDVANRKRQNYTGGGRAVVVEPQKKGMGLGSVIALVLGVAAAVGVVVAAWQALRADDELWVADDPLSPPNA
ncbi:DNA helicase [Microbacterium sp. H1-D42]|uniref:DNA helicase n=1 Tax=Microbacterium sp. H1-D42 TaxID=2925844 RepID=UPI001F538929|nr:DNA helicase [Microbacterium sp. H1-D42]UNK70870.1 DNA helicase [Microbacterium sp. H1-D42]